MDTAEAIEAVRNDLLIFARLAADFTGNDVKWRKQNGRDMPYVTARTVMNRLDDVLGPACWWDEYQPIENAVICRLTIQLPNDQFLTKCDVGGFTTTADTSDYEKSGFSDAFKRAAVKFGVGRHLYGDGVPRFVSGMLSHAGEAPPQQAARREPEPDYQEARRQQPRPYQDRPTPGPSGGRQPRTGKALFAWVKERDEKMGFDLLRTLNDWGKAQGYPPRMVQWSDEEVHHAYAEANHVIEGFGVNGSNRSNGNGAH